MLGSRPELSEQWVVPESNEQLHELIKDGRHPVLIYKHSYNCGTCIFSKLNVEKLFGEYGEKATFIFIDVITQRSISNHIAEFAGVKHESPQVLLFKEGELIWHESHGAITESGLMKALEN